MKEESKLVYQTKSNNKVPIEKWRAKLFEILDKMKTKK
jgi:hypothetical protein